MRLLIVFSLLLSGCASMEPSVRTHHSNTDNVTETAIDAGWLGAVGTPRLGLFRKSNMKPNEVMMIVALKGAAPATKDGLTINIDGKKTVLSAMDDLSDFDQYGDFQKRYSTTLDVVRQMVAGKSVWVKVTHVGQTYSEGEFSKDSLGGAKRAFIKFLNEVGK